MSSLQLGVVPEAHGALGPKAVVAIDRAMRAARRPWWALGDVGRYVGLVGAEPGNRVKDDISLYHTILIYYFSK